MTLDPPMPTFPKRAFKTTQKKNSPENVCTAFVLHPYSRIAFQYDCDGRFWALIQSKVMY